MLTRHFSLPPWNILGVSLEKLKGPKLNFTGRLPWQHSSYHSSFVAIEAHTFVKFEGQGQGCVTWPWKGPHHKMSSSYISLERLLSQLSSDTKFVEFPWIVLVLHPIFCPRVPFSFETREIFKLLWSNQINSDQAENWPVLVSSGDLSAWQI